MSALRGRAVVRLKVAAGLPGVVAPAGGVSRAFELPGNNAALGAPQGLCRLAIPNVCDSVIISIE